MPEHETVYVYSRTQALASGALRDITELARDAGFGYPVALTEDAWTHAVAWDHDDEQGQSVTSRTRAVLTTARAAASTRRPSRAPDRYEFIVLRLINGSADTRPHPIRLVLRVGPGDDGEPVVTIMTARDQ